MIFLNCRHYRRKRSSPWRRVTLLVPAVLAAILSAHLSLAVSPPTEAEMSSVLTSADNGRTVELHVGDQVALRLPENPTTGYRWAIDSSDANLVDVKQGEFAAKSGAVGGGGEAQWSITAKAPGATSIRLKRWRPWEGDSSVVERYGITLQISP